MEDNNITSKKVTTQATSKIPRVYIKVSCNGGVIPKKADDYAIGYDLYCPDDILIPAHSRKVIDMGIAMSLPRGMEAKIEARSGHSLKGMDGLAYERVVTKRFLGIPIKSEVMKRTRFNADVLTGKIDPGYHGNIGVIIKNDDCEFIISKGTKIAQMTFYKAMFPSFNQVVRLVGYDRGGGFGSTDKKKE